MDPTDSLLDWQYMISAIPRIAQGIPVTLAITVVAFGVGLVGGLGGALARIHRVPVLHRLVTVQISFARGTPLLVQIFLAYYGIPILLDWLDARYGWGIDISSIPAIAFMYVAFSFNVSAYLSESWRAALLAVPPGEVEAAKALGMTGGQTLRRVVLPQAAVLALPNLGNTLISLLKETSLAFAAAVPEIMGQAKISAARTSSFLEAYLVAAALYWTLCTILERVLHGIERRLARGQRREDTPVVAATEPTANQEAVRA